MLAAAALAYSLTTSLHAVLSPASCSFDRLNPPISVRDIALNDDRTFIEFFVSRRLDSSDLREFSFAYIQNGEKHIARCSDSCASCSLLAPGETKKYTISLDEGDVPTNIAFAINGCQLETHELQ